MGKFVIYRVATGYTFHLKAGNGAVIATSEVYSGEAACRKGIASVQCNAPESSFLDLTLEGAQTQPNPRFELYADKSGAFRFRLKAKNGEIIAVSEGYHSKQSCRKGIKSVRENAPDAAIVLDRSAMQDG